MATEQVDPSSIRPHPDKVRRYPRDDGLFRQLVESVRSEGVLTTITVDGENFFVDGLARWEAAIEAGRPTVPVRRY